MKITNRVYNLVVNEQESVTHWSVTLDEVTRRTNDSIVLDGVRYYKRQ